MILKELKFETYYTYRCVCIYIITPVGVNGIAQVCRVSPELKAKEIIHNSTIPPRQLKGEMV